MVSFRNNLSKNENSVIFYLKQYQVKVRDSGFGLQNFVEFYSKKNKKAHMMLFKSLKAQNGSEKVIIYNCFFCFFEDVTVAVKLKKRLHAIGSRCTRLYC